LTIDVTAVASHDVIDRTGAAFVGLENNCRRTRNYAHSDRVDQLAVEHAGHNVGAKPSSCSQERPHRRTWRTGDQPNQGAGGGSDDRAKERTTPAFQHRHVSVLVLRDYDAGLELEIDTTRVFQILDRFCCIV